jgi:hypothetical protein
MWGVLDERVESRALDPRREASGGDALVVKSITYLDFRRFVAMTAGQDIRAARPRPKA